MSEDRSQELTGSDYYETPPEIFEPLQEEFNFTVDVCASKWTAKCARFFSPQDDGLEKSWAGETVWCNPPYSNVGRWMRKAWEESQKPGTTVVLLVWARLDSSWSESYILPDKRDGISESERRKHNAAEMRFPRGRVSFLLRGERQGSPMLPAMVVVFRHGHVGSPLARSIPKAKQRALLAKSVIRKKAVARALL